MTIVLDRPIESPVEIPVPEWVHEVGKPESKPLSVTQQILLRAATIIETEGWTRYSLKDGNGYCAIGAIHEAIVRLVGPMSKIGVDGWCLAERSVTERLRPFTRTGVIMAWNDSSSSKEPIIAGLRKAAML